MQYKDKPVPIRILKKAFEFGTRERLCLADLLFNTGIVSERHFTAVLRLAGACLALTVD